MIRTGTLVARRSPLGDASGHSGDYDWRIVHPVPGFSRVFARKFWKKRLLVVLSSEISLKNCNITMCSFPSCFFWKIRNIFASILFETDIVDFEVKINLLIVLYIHFLENYWCYSFCVE